MDRRVGGRAGWQAYSDSDSECDASDEPVNSASAASSTDVSSRPRLGTVELVFSSPLLLFSFRDSDLRRGARMRPGVFAPRFKDDTRRVWQALMFLGSLQTDTDNPMIRGGAFLFLFLSLFFNSSAHHRPPPLWSSSPPVTNALI